MWIVKVTHFITYWYTSFVRAVPSNILEHKFTNRYILQNPPPHCYWKAEGLSEMHPISYQSRSLSPLMLFQFSYFIFHISYSICDISYFLFNLWYFILCISRVPYRHSCSSISPLPYLSLIRPRKRLQCTIRKTSKTLLEIGQKILSF